MYRYLNSLIHDDDYDNFKSNTCHFLKQLGDRDFLFHVISEQWIPVFFRLNMPEKAFYILALTDYLSETHGMPPFAEYDEYRSLKLPITIFPKDILYLNELSQEDEKKKAIKKAQNSEIGKRFLKFNIIEDDIRNVW